LLVAVALSAQATDKGVNKATAPLVQDRRHAGKDGGAGRGQRLAEAIKTIGLYRGKAKNVIALSKILIERHGSAGARRPRCAGGIAGVGRKTANVVLNVAFGEPTIAVDTHIFRVSNRTGLAPGKNVLEVELSLEKRVPEKYKPCPSLADPAWPLHLRGAQAFMSHLHGARSVPVQRQDKANATAKTPTLSARKAQGRPAKKNNLRCLCRGRAQGREASRICCALFSMRQGLDMTHGQRFTVKKKESAAGLPVVAPHLGDAVLAHEIGASERRFKAGCGHVEVLAWLAPGRGRRNAGLGC
jgi:endonuclease III-like uncharacterized protein